MVVQHNLPAINSHRQMGVNNSGTAKNLEKLSSGYRINRAGDDAAGLAISEKMRGQIRGLDMATTNAQNDVALIKTAEGGLNETHAILQRMRELAVQSSNGTYHDDVDRENINKEIQALKTEVNRIATSTHYNGIKLLNGDLDREVLGTIDIKSYNCTSTFGGNTCYYSTGVVGTPGSVKSNHEISITLMADPNDDSKIVVEKVSGVTAEIDSLNQILMTMDDGVNFRISPLSAGATPGSVLKFVVNYALDGSGAFISPSTPKVTYMDSKQGGSLKVTASQMWTFLLVKRLKNQLKYLMPPSIRCLLRAQTLARRRTASNTLSATSE